MSYRISTVLFLLVLAAITPKINAQQSAQAVMKVSASVIKGASVTHQLPAMVDLDLTGKSELHSEIGTVSVRHGSDSGILITSDSQILLTNEKGAQLPLLIKTDRNRTKGHDQIRYSAKPDLNGGLDGHYEGEHMTVVEYI